MINDCSKSTQGEIEAAVCAAMNRFEQEYMGRGPKDIRASLIDNVILVRLQGVLTDAEKHLVKNKPNGDGIELLKKVRTHLFETALPMITAIVQDITGVKLVSLHHDISTVTGEKIVVFTLSDPPSCRLKNS